jgi:hypothetical protein
MQAQKERWQQLCEAVVVEQDPVRFQQLVDQLNDLLEAKERRLDAQRRNHTESIKVQAFDGHSNSAQSAKVLFPPIASVDATSSI